VNLIDTADVYGGGRSEGILGQVLKGRRDEVILATKFHNPIGSGVKDRGKVRYLGSTTFPSFVLLESLWASERRGLERFASEQLP